MAHSTLATNGGTGPNLWTYGTRQYGVTVLSDDASVRVYQFNAVTKALEETFDPATISSNPLSLPLDASDPHETAGLGVTPNGILYVAANNFTNDQPPRIVKTTGAAVDIGVNTNWANATSDFYNPGAGHQLSYFKFARFAGSLLLIYRIRVTGGNPGYERVFRHNGTSWSDLGYLSQGAAGTEDAFYRNHLFVEGPRDPHPNRGHLFGAWDQATGGAGIDCDGFSYLYTDDEATSWHTITGATVTTPFNMAGTPDTGITFGTSTVDNLYANGVAVDAAGYPCGLYHKRTTPQQGQHIIRWNGTTWTDDTTVFFRFASTQAVMLARHRGDLWTIGRPINTGVNTRAELRRVAAPNDVVNLAGPVGSGWHCYFDPAALQDDDTIEMLHIDDDLPSVATFGNGARAIAA